MMRNRLGVLVFLACALTRTHGGELRLVDGRVIPGTPLKADAQGVDWREGPGPAARVAMDQIARIDVSAPPARNPAESWSDIELTDGTTLRAVKLVFARERVKAELVGGGEAAFPLKSVSNILFPAQRDDWRKDWTTRQAQRKRKDILAVVRQDAVNALEGALGEPDAEGKAVPFTPSGTDRTVPVPFGNIHGLMFERLPDPNLAPVVARVTDAGGSLWLAADLAFDGTRWSLKTSGGVAREFAPDRPPVRIDMSRGKVVYLSDLKWMRATDPLSADPFRFRAGPTLDKNLDLGPIRMGGSPFSKGLGLSATTEVEYDLGGEYRDLRLVAGFDDTVGGVGPVVLRVEGDGKELLRQTVARQGRKSSLPLVVPVKDVRRLTITVEPASASDIAYGLHLHLGDARLTR